MKKSILYWLVAASLVTVTANAQKITSVYEAGGGNPGIEMMKKWKAQKAAANNPKAAAKMAPYIDEPIFDNIGIARNTLITTGAGLHEDEAYVWGFRGSAQQGNGQMVVKSNAAPQKVKSPSGAPFAALTGGAYHLLALDYNGDVWGWGQTGYGETGCKKGGYATAPCKVLSDAVYIAAGEYFSMALTDNGEVYTWGHNLYGQLGSGPKNKKNSHIPLKVDLQGEKARLIGAAYEGGFAVTEQGHVWAWGDNEASGLGFQGPNYGVQKIIRTPTHITNLDAYADKMVYIAGGNGWGEALLEDGRVIGWGLQAALGQGTTKTKFSDPKPKVIAYNIVQMHARYVGTTVLTKTGEVATWGQTGGSAFPMIYGEEPYIRETVANDPVVSVGGGKEHVFYKTESGKIYGVGYNDLYKLDQSKCCAPIIQWPGSLIKLNP